MAGGVLPGPPGRAGLAGLAGLAGGVNAEAWHRIDPSREARPATGPEHRVDVERCGGHLVIPVELTERSRKQPTGVVGTDYV
jgi:hypothetical protein